MNKSEFITAVSEKSGITKTDIENILSAEIDVITATLKKGEKVRITGFGTFEPRFRKATTATNPKTKEKVKVPAKTVAKFVAGKTLAEAVVKVSKKKIEAAKEAAKNKQ